MKAILEFNLPEDNEVYQYTTKAWELANCLKEFDQYLRGLEKYEDKETVSIEEARNHLRDIVYENTELDIF